MIIKRGNRIIDTDYHSKKFGTVEMDITAVVKDREIDHGTTRYLNNLKRKRRERFDSV